MTRSLDRMVDQAYRGRSAADILNASPDALLGVSGADAIRLKDAFGITTVRGMAQSVHFRRAQAVLAATGNPAFDAGPPLDWEDFFADAPRPKLVANDIARDADGPAHERPAAVVSPVPFPKYHRYVLHDVFCIHEAET